MSDFREAMKEISRANDLLDVIDTLRRQNAALRWALEKVEEILDKACSDMEVVEAYKVAAQALALTPAAPDETREKAELLDWLLSTEDFAFELCLALNGEFDSINGTPRDQALAALRAAKAGGK